ncbi:MAG TPA: CHAT domain-containing tetratricopeptide repeat protein [Terriglobales bacterium]|nr:CHAT domain-containing tetratricopeptide repeat protein [Terriglobales bacterium]
MSAGPAQQRESDAILERLLAEPDDAARRNLVLRCPTANWEEIVSLLCDRVRQEVQVSTARAQHMADAAMLAAETVGSKVAQGKSRRAKANTLYAMDQHEAAVEMHQHAAALFEEAGEKGELARTLSGTIQPLLLLGRYDDALAAAERARAIFAEQGNTWRQARLEINVGNIYQRQDRFEEALEHYQRAYQDLLSRDDAEGLAAVLSNLSLCYISLNEFPKALEFHRRARRHCQEKGMPILVAYADYNIAYLYFLRGKYGRAIQMLRDAMASAKKAEDAYQLALCDLDLSEIYLEVNLVAEAADLSRMAHEGFEKLGFGYEAAKAQAFAAIAASRQGQAFEGLQLFVQAKEGFVREKNHAWPPLIDLYQALVLLQEGRLFEARRLCAAALDFFRASTMRRKAVLADLLLARIALRMNDAATARLHCDAALQQARQLDSPMLLYQAELLLGEIHQAAGDEPQAYACYSRARTSLETLRGSLRAEELKIAFFDNKLGLYEHLVDLCLRRKDALQEAFGYIEQAKSRCLMDLMTQPVHVAPDNDAGQSELVRSIRNLREELNWYYNLIEREQLRPEENSQARIEKLEQQARARETALTRALQEATVTEVNQAGIQAPTNIPLEEIRASLPADTLLVEYFSVGDKILSCVLGQDDLQIHPITLQSRVQRLLQLLQFQLAKFRLDPQYVSKFQDSLLESTQAHLKSLYEELLAPLSGSLPAKRLVFVPHGSLHYVPFHALYDGERYLVDRFEISYAPSASIYSLCQRSRAEHDGEPLLMGIADAQAPSILDEVLALKTLLPAARLFTGGEATQKVLEQHAPGSRILHIATHGSFRQDNPMFSSIRLGDSYLSLHDLYHLKLPVDLVVLSGCATGVSVIKPGDEQMGLVRGLLQAGAQSLVLSLWDVHDRSTKEFMVSFYKLLQQGLAKASALREAMIDLRARYPHPYYWAPFLLIGKG